MESDLVASIEELAPSFEKAIDGYIRSAKSRYTMLDVGWIYGYMRKHQKEFPEITAYLEDCGSYEVKTVKYLLNVYLKNTKRRNIIVNTTTYQPLEISMNSKGTTTIIARIATGEGK